MIPLLTELSEYLKRQLDEASHGGPNKAMLLKRDVDAEIERLKNAAPQAVPDRNASSQGSAPDGSAPQPAVAAPTHDCTANMQARCAICGALPNSSPAGPNGEPRFAYTGRVYVRPVGRGVVLEDLPGEPHFEDSAPEGDHYAELRLFATSERTP